MSDIKNCDHINQVTDEHEGCVICSDCGLVVSTQLFIDDHKMENNLDDNEPYKEFLDRLNIPMPNLINRIEQKTNNQSLSCISTLASNLYLSLNKTSSVSLKEIVSVTGANEKKIVKKTRGHTTILNKEILLDKYCSQLKLDYKSYTLIKETFKKLELTGHNPLTIIASSIYAFCKKTKQKISMKKVADTVGISCISIQRFLKLHKDELSYGC
jgi:transcription initiation factor TFIIIB Brf1 subunit/transcription initiation factor TFIIB